MKRWTIIALAAAAPHVGCAPPETDGPAPWTGGLAEGLDEIARLAGAAQHDEALAVADRMVVPDAYARFRADLDRWTGGGLERALAPVTELLDWIGVDALSARALGEVEFARGAALVLRAESLEAEERDAVLGDAEEAFERARAAGGDVRADAVCALGVLDLVEGEAARATIPEISGAPAAAAPPPGNPAGPPATQDDAPDPLEVARGRYLAAKDHFVEGLRFHPELAGDARRAEVRALTRAGSELCIRRLRELDELEQQREEQQPPPEEQPQDGESSEGNPDGEPQDQEPSEQSPEEQQEGEQPEEQQEGEAEEQEGEEESESEPDSEQEIEERAMTKEELERFLEEARENQEEGEERRRSLIRKRKVPTQRDW